MTRADSVVDRVIGALVARVENGEFSAGERLPPETDLAADLDVSRLSLREAVRRSDRFMETTLARSLCMVWLAADDVAHARADLDRRAWSPPEGGYHLQHWYELRARSEIDLYQRDAAGTRARVESELEQLSRALWMRVQIVRTEALWLRGRLLLASATPAAPRATPAAVSRVAARLEREPACLELVARHAPVRVPRLTLHRAGPEGIFSEHAKIDGVMVDAATWHGFDDETRDYYDRITFEPG